MNIRPDRLREIADGAMGIGAPLVLTQAEQVAVCTELLACREERDAANYRAEKAENDLRCVTLTGDAVASDSSLYRGNSVRYWYDKCQAYKNSAGELAAERERFNLLSQRCDAAERERNTLRVDHDMAEGEADHALDGEWFADLCDAIGKLRTQRDAARAEAEKLTKRVQSMGSSMEHHVAAQTAKLTAELAAVKRQRDELVKACSAKDDLLACYRLGKRPSETLFKRLDKAKKVLDDLAAEQPKPQQPKPPEVQP